MERDNSRLFLRQHTGNFNSRAHVERDSAKNLRMRFLPISTHALTWSATKSGVKVDGAHIISTHALTWSATSCHDYGNRCLDYFNSRAHVERDVSILPLKTLYRRISTHALTWSATFYLYYSTFRAICHFNSRAHVERDVKKRRRAEN